MTYFSVREALPKTVLDVGPLFVEGPSRSLYCLVSNLNIKLTRRRVLVYVLYFTFVGLDDEEQS